MKIDMGLIVNRVIGYHRSRITELEDEISRSGKVNGRNLSSDEALRAVTAIGVHARAIQDLENAFRGMRHAKEKDEKSRAAVFRAIKRARSENGVPGDISELDAEDEFYAPDPRAETYGRGNPGEVPRLLREDPGQGDKPLHPDVLIEVKRGPDDKDPCIYTVARARKLDWSNRWPAPTITHWRYTGRRQQR